MAQGQQQAGAPQASRGPGLAGGLPPDAEVFSPFPFKGMNVKGSPIGIDDAQFAWLENIMWIGEGQLAFLLSNVLIAIYSVPAGRRIVAYSFFVLGQTQYIAVFLDDGSAIQVNILTSMTVQIGPPGTFTSTTPPVTATYGAKYLLIATSAGYWAWDGTLLYGPGTLAPQIVITSPGLNYTSAPTISFVGGAGSGAAATATIADGQVISAAFTNPGAGYLPNDGGFLQVFFTGGGSTNAIAEGTGTLSGGTLTAVNLTTGGSGYLIAPSVEITDPYGYGTGAAATANLTGGVVTSVTVTAPGEEYEAVVINFVGGNPTVATATVELMPQGGPNPIGGTAIQVFKNRVWLVKGNTRYTSAAGDIANFSASAGGVISQNNDNFLIYNLFGLAQSSGFLYELGDSSTNAISNPTTTVTTTGGVSVASTTYTVTNVDPQVGCIWPLTIQAFGEAIIFANPTGIYGLYGSSVRKISNDLDDLFNQLPAQPQIPSACTVTLFGIKCYAVTLYVTDPNLQQVRQLIFLWDGFRWFCATQDAPIISLVTVGNGGQFTAYGSDGINIYQLFSRGSTTLQKRLVSKYYGASSAYKFKKSMRFYLSAEQPFSYDVTLHSELGDVDLGPNPYPQTQNGGTTSGGYGKNLTVQAGPDTKGVSGRYLGWTLVSTAAGNNLDYLALAWVPDAPYY